MELRPCPFCGGKAKFERMAGCQRYRAVCDSCNVCTNWKWSERQAAETWNRRYEPPNEPLTLEELREMDGEPVWISFTNHPNAGFWDIVETCWELFYTLHLKTHGALPLEEMGETWLAYRRRPEEGKS